MHPNRARQWSRETIAPLVALGPHFWYHPLGGRSSIPPSRKRDPKIDLGNERTGAQRIPCAIHAHAGAFSLPRLRFARSRVIRSKGVTGDNCFVAAPIRAPVCCSEPSIDRPLLGLCKSSSGTLALQIQFWHAWDTNGPHEAFRAGRDNVPLPP
jgi:hypothetical protein